MKDKSFQYKKCLVVVVAVVRFVLFLLICFFDFLSFFFFQILHKEFESEIIVDCNNNFTWLRSSGNDIGRDLHTRQCLPYQIPEFIDWALKSAIKNLIKIALLKSARILRRVLET